jgi:glycyl-tRNA synthetase beta chain
VQYSGNTCALQKDKVMSGELLLEIGTEEIPAGFVSSALEGMKTCASSELEAQRIQFDTVTTMGTPRRLTLCVKGMAEKQTESFVDTMGPPEKVAFDAEGNPTQAAEGFASRQGVSVADLEIVATKKGNYVRVRKKVEGKEVVSLLPVLLEKIGLSIPFPKSMRWADFDMRFARPMQWILAIFNGATVPMHLENLTSSNTSRGHRFLSNTSFAVNDLRSYLHLTQKHFVIPEIEKRKEHIQNEARKLAEEVGGAVLEDEGLLDIVTNLVEYPVTLRGGFDEQFLRLPRDVLISSMREHQKYFSVIDEHGMLLPYFIVVTNNQVLNPQVVIKGNERVLSARLADARFFFDEDRKTTLVERVTGLKHVVYQAKLGSMYTKVSRLQELTSMLSQEIDNQLVETVQRAAFLCKADLLTEMVGEFPALQGIVGREYALLEGESPDVAKAIYEHYLPTSGKGDVPTAVAGSILSIADKVDTIVGCFAVGLIPTGTADPHALRRQALGIMSILQEKGFHLDLTTLIERSLALFDIELCRSQDEIKREVLDFFRARFHHRLTSSGYSYDVVEAVTSTHFADPVDVLERIKALKEIKGHPDFEPLVITFKRVANIIASAPHAQVDPRLCEEEAEKALYDSCEKARSTLEQLIGARDYPGALTHLVTLKPNVDRFFDEVMVMCENERVRLNRLGLLKGVAALFRRIADFSKIVTEGKEGR